MLEPEEQELYVKDERLLRQDAVRNAMNNSQVVIIVVSEEYQTCPLLRAEAEHAVMLSKRGACKVHFLFTQPYYCPQWDERPRTANGEIKVTTQRRKSSVTEEEVESHEPHGALCSEEAARRVTFKDARWGREKPYLFSEIPELHPVHRPLTGWLRSIMPTNNTWFSLWSEVEIDWLADHLQNHLDKPILKTQIITRDYFRGY